MKRKIPLKVYAQIAVGFFFSLLILLYFSFRLLFPILLQIFNLEVAAYITFFLCFGLCSLMVKPTINKEMGKIGEPFSIVARNPEIEILKEKLTLNSLFIKGLLSIVVAFILSLPLTLIIFFRFIANPYEGLSTIFALVHGYAHFYWFFIGVSIFAIFIIVPSLKRWHWTKHQF